MPSNAITSEQRVSVTCRRPGLHTLEIVAPFGYDPLMLRFVPSPFSLIFSLF